MPVHNNEIAETFELVADLLDLQNANEFRIRAYRNAAGTISNMSRNAADLIEKGEDMSELPDIGVDLADKIREIVKTGKLKQLQELEERTPPTLTELMKISELGPKRVIILHKELGINDKKELKDAAESERIRELDGFGEKTERNILEALEREKNGEKDKRTMLNVAEEIARPLVEYLRNTKGVKTIETAGSYRRRKETVGDLDILVSCKKGCGVMDRFVEYEDVQKVISKGKTRSSVLLRSNFQVDLRVVPQVSYGAALFYFTGSKAHNIEVRKLGQKRKLKINEYGVFKRDDRIASKTEKDVLESVGVSYIEPELRENRGEIDAVRKNRLPKLIGQDDIRGDLQSHSTHSDGKFTIEEMAEAARELGYEYLAITDHSKRVTMATGLDARRLGEEINEIDKLNQKWQDFRILKSSEVDILEDGSLDLPDEILKELDIVVCSIHYSFKLSKAQQTSRIIKAMDNPHFNILAHPTGRIIGQRPGYDLDLAEVIKAAKERGCFLELNAQPKRLDLADVHAKIAKDMGLKLAISTDAHTKNDLDHMRFGISQARRGWLEKRDVINTRSWKELKKLVQRG